MSSPHTSNKSPVPKSPTEKNEAQLELIIKGSKRRKLQFDGTVQDDDVATTPIPMKVHSPSVQKHIRRRKMVQQPLLSASANSVTSTQHGESVKRKVDTLHDVITAQLRRKEIKLDIDLRRAKLKQQNLRRARAILAKDDKAQMQKLITKWRSAAQKASNYLLNAAVEKINRSGGKREFNRLEKERLRERIEHSIDNSFQDRIHNITHSEQYRLLSEKEKETILEDLEKEQEDALEEAERTYLKSQESEEENEFTMKDLYKKLKLDHKLVFPNNE